jgi:hypothetical protein
LRWGFEVMLVWFSLRSVKTRESKSSKQNTIYTQAKMEDKFNYRRAHKLSYKVINAPDQVTDFFYLSFDQVENFKHLYSKVQVLAEKEGISPLELIRMKKYPESVELEELQEFQMDLAYKHCKKNHSPSLTKMRVVEISFTLDLSYIVD